MDLGFEISSDGKRVKCTICAPLIAAETKRWIQWTSWKGHLESPSHDRAVDHEKQRTQARADRDRAMITVLAEDQDAETNLPQIRVSSTTAGPSRAPREISANEAAIWEDIAMGEVEFSAGDMPDETADRQRLERELSNAGLSGATNLADGFFQSILDDTIVSDDEDEVLADVLEYASSKSRSPLINLIFLEI